MTSDTSGQRNRSRGEYEPVSGDRVRDVLTVASGEKANEMVVLWTYPGREADDYYIEAVGTSLAGAAPDWNLHMKDDADYNPHKDMPVEVAFVNDLDGAFGTRWRNWNHENLRDSVAESSAVTVYTYHAERLVPTKETLAD